MNYAFHMILIPSMLTVEWFFALDVLDYRTRRLFSNALTNNLLIIWTESYSDMILNDTTMKKVGSPDKYQAVRIFNMSAMPKDDKISTDLVSDRC